MPLLTELGNLFGGVGYKYAAPTVLPAANPAAGIAKNAGNVSPSPWRRGPG
jgi:hypothetical protein